MMDDLVKASRAYLDELFGAGAGESHTKFVDRLAHPHLREALHRAHVLESDTTHLSVEENYLIGMSVLLAQRAYAPAAMFAKTLRHLGVPAAKLVEVTARLEMWIGGVAAAEAAAHVQKAIKEYDTQGMASLAGWFPK